MGNKVEKTFEERLASLKRGCVILGNLQAISVYLSLKAFLNGTDGLVSLILSVVLLAMLYFIYKYTKERNPLGPMLEKIFGILLLVDGIIYCITIIGLLFGIIDIILAIGILDEAKYFKAEIEKE